MYTNVYIYIYISNIQMFVPRCILIVINEHLKNVMKFAPIIFFTWFSWKIIFFNLFFLKQLHLILQIKMRIFVFLNFRNLIWDFNNKYLFFVFVDMLIYFFQRQLNNRFELADNKGTSLAYYLLLFCLLWFVYYLYIRY